MTNLTFRRYTAESGSGTPSVQWVVGVPGDIDVPQVVGAAGFDPENREAIRLALLKRPWNGHPEGALVVAETPSLSAGDAFAVSDQQSSPPE